MVKLEKTTANKIQKKGEKRMKNTKKITFVCIAINILLLLQLCLGTVMALDEDTAYNEPEQTVEEAVISEEVVIETQDGEFQPIMPTLLCPPTYTYDNGFAAWDAANAAKQANPGWDFAPNPDKTNCYILRNEIGAIQGYYKW